MQFRSIIDKKPPKYDFCILDESLPILTPNSSYKHQKKQLKSILVVMPKKGIFQRIDVYLSNLVGVVQQIARATTTKAIKADDFREILNLGVL